MVNKLAITLLSVAIFFLVANPLTYKLTTKIFGPWVAHQGCPTFPGFLLHVLVYGLITRGIMG